MTKKDTSTVDYTDILNVKAGNAVEPKTLPEGTYEMFVKDYEVIKSAKKGTPGIKLTYALTQAMEDVDPDELEDFESYKPLTQVELVGNHTTMWLTEGTAHRVEQDFEKVFGENIEGKTYGEILETIKDKGEPILGEIYHEFSEDGERTFANLKSISAA